MTPTFAFLTGYLAGVVSTCLLIIWVVVLTKRKR